MYEIPLFPLNTVLFPGMPIGLHIFEERYKKMMGHCIAARRPFGVALIRRGVEANGPPAEPHPVGCAAQITQVQSLEEGRMNILAIARERFRIVSLKHEQPYLVGVVERFPLRAAGAEELREAGRRLRPWVGRYLDVLAETGEVKLDAGQLPGEPLELAHLAAYLLQIPAEQKQALLAAEGEAPFLSDLRASYRREVAFLRMMMARPQEERGGDSFSLN